MISKKTSDADDAFRKAEESISRGDARRGFSNLLETLGRDPLHHRALASAASTAKMLGDSRGAELFEALGGDPENPQHLYGVGYHLIEMGRSDIALRFLEACLERSPGNDDVRYELGYALFLNRDYEKAAENLSAAAENLSPDRSAAAGLLHIESLLYGGRVGEAEDLMQRIGDELRSIDRQDSLEALELMARRLRRFEDRRPSSVREWHFVQHGGALLAESRAAGKAGRFQSLAMNPAAVAAILRLLGAFLDGMGIDPLAIIHPGGDSEVLALAAGHILGKPVRPFGKRTGTRELLVIDDPLSLEGIEKEVVPRDSVDHIFCFRLDPSGNGPVLPDIAGLMADVFRFPWQERVEVYKKPGAEPKARSFPADERDNEILAREIADFGYRLPEDKKMASVLKFYWANRDLLVATNRESFPFRRAFTTFSPV